MQFMKEKEGYEILTLQGWYRMLWDWQFEEYLTEADCEILKPYFINQTKDISMKDYIEVNSAISIGLMGLGEGISGMNFKKKSFSAFNSVATWAAKLIEEML
mgnify:CR=1 FL=1